jgi:hypothetical protein
MAYHRIFNASGMMCSINGAELYSHQEHLSSPRD